MSKVPSHDEICGHVDSERNQHEEAADDEQHPIVRTSLDGLAELGGNRRGQRPHGIEDAMWSLYRVAGGHEDRHGFANGSSDPQESRRQKPVLRRRKESPGGQLPAAGAQCQCSFPIGVGDGLESVLSHRRDDRHAHQREDESTIQDVDTDGSARGPDDHGVQHHVADEPPHDRRNGGEKLNDDLQRFSGLGAAELRDEDRRAEASRHENRHRQCRHRSRAGDEREDPVLGTNRRIRSPIDGGEELAEIERPENHRCAFMKHEDKNREDEENTAPPAEPDDRLHHRLGQRPESAA